jgi:hypothetical protein
MTGIGLLSPLSGIEIDLAVVSKQTNADSLAIIIVHKYDFTDKLEYC